MFRKFSIFSVALVAVLQARCSGCGGSANTQKVVNDNNDGGSDGGDNSGGNPDGGGGIFVGVTDGKFPPPNGGGVQFDPNAGGITLRGGLSQYAYAWIANTNDGTVSKYDTKTAKEVARYYTVIPRDGQGNPTAMRYQNHNSPSRTAIDLNGDVWVANRANSKGVQGSVTKIANDLASCRHSLPDGGVHTSQDLNGNGQIDTDPSLGEFIVPTASADPSTYDDCVLFSTPLGGTFDGQDFYKVRALAISPPTLESGSAGTIWAGHFAENNLYRLRSTDGTVIPLPDGSPAVHLSWGNVCGNYPQLAPYCDGPYGAAVDGSNRLWIVDNGTALVALIDANTGNLINDRIAPPADNRFGVSPGTYGSYGIAIDGKARLWLGGWFTGAASDGTPLGSAWRYDHGPGLSANMGTWTLFTFPNARSQIGTKFGVGRGIAADVLGTIWMSGSFNTINYGNNPNAGVAQLIGFNQDDGTIRQFHLQDGTSADFIDVTSSTSNTSIGVGLDSDNNVWVNNFSGNAMKVSRDTGQVAFTASQPGGNLYTYSDFTGYQLRNFTVPEGDYTQDYCKCPHARWGPATWVADTPPGTAVRLFFKVADPPADLNNTNLPEFGPYDSGASLQPQGVGMCIRVRFNLQATPDHQRSPVLRSFKIGVACPTLG